MNYRVNFGNGQVHYAGSKQECLQFTNNYGDGYTFIECQDKETDEWFMAKTNDLLKGDAK